MWKEPFEMNKMISQKLITGIVAAFLMIQAASCSVFSDSIMTGRYRIAGDGKASESVLKEESLVIGQKDSGKCLESYSLKFNAPEGKDISIAYRSYIQDIGWSDWSPSEQEIACAQDGSIETVQIMLFGKDAFMYDVSYRIAVVGQDWQDWVSNGTMTGIPGQNLPIEAVEIKLESHESYDAPAWTITEFSDDSGNQAMFYTMRNNNNGTLIVIDGGYDANADQVRSVIELFGGHVDYWFLTHYDEDHASVFNNIYADPQGIEIGTVFCTPLDYDYYSQLAADRWWDTPWVYETFLNLTAGDDNICYLARGDEFEIDGLTVKVFNSYDQIIVDTGTADVANYGSLMFKITGEEDSFLVCGDVYGDILGDILLNIYGDEMKADIVQPGHHGNGSMSPYFYEVIEPKVMFFDGPAWLTESDEYTAKALKDWCDSSGIKTYTFGTAPNSIPFE